MTRAWQAAGGLALAAGLALVLGSAGASDQKNPSIKEIMNRAHKGGESLLAEVRAELRADDPSWPEVQKNTHELVTLGAALGKNNPPRGEKASWDRLTRSYVATARSLEDAARKQDRDQAQAAFKKLQMTCGACHRAHKPEE